MPKIYRYAKRDGMYIRSAFGNRVATYQVTPAGCRFLAERGLTQGDNLGVSDLHSMRSRGLIFTGEGGAGSIEMAVSSSPAAKVSPDPGRPARPLSVPVLEPTPVARPIPRLDTTPNVGRAGGAPGRPEASQVVRGGEGRGLPAPKPAACAPLERDQVDPIRAISRPARPDSDPRPPAPAESKGGKLIGFVLVLALLDLVGMGAHWGYALLLSFAMMVGFHAWQKDRFFYEGFLWGQFAGPIGLLVVLMLPAGEPPRSRTHDSTAPVPPYEGSRIHALILVIWFCLVMLLALAFLSRQKSIG